MSLLCKNNYTRRRFRRELQCKKARGYKVDTEFVVKKELKDCRVSNIKSFRIGAAVFVI